jgi:hypothetical protein
MNMKRIIVSAILVIALCGVASAQRVPSQWPRTVDVTIAAGGSLSAGVNFQGCTIARMTIPTITSAALTFQVSGTGGSDYKELFDFFGSAVSYPASTGNVTVVMNPADWYGVRFLKVRSGTAASAVTQDGGAVITFTCKD